MNEHPVQLTKEKLKGLVSNDTVVDLNGLEYKVITNNHECVVSRIDSDVITPESAWKWRAYEK